MPFPVTRAAMIQDGYTFTNHGQCKGCLRPIEWWRSPRDAPICMDPMNADTSRPKTHFATCPKADQFRKGKSIEPASQGSLF